MKVDVTDLRREALRNLWWLVPAVLLLLNLLLLMSYRSIYAGRVEVLDSVISADRQELRRLEQQEVALANLVRTSKDARQGVVELYDELFATESERLTGVMREVRELAARAGVRPDSVSYPEELFEDYGLIKRSIVFNVDGDYRQLRLFINYLELSDAFVALESLGLQDSAEGLRIRVRVSTLFTGRDREARATEATESEGRS